MDFRDRLFDLRRQAGLSQEALAAKIGVSRQAVSKWELGETTPDVEKLVVLARSFGVTADELLGMEEPVRETEMPAPQPSRLPEDVDWVVRRSAKFRRWYTPIYMGLIMLIVGIGMCIQVWGVVHDTVPYVEKTMRPVRYASAALAALGAGEVIWGVVRLIRHRRREKNGKDQGRKP